MASALRGREVEGEAVTRGFLRLDMASKVRDVFFRENEEELLFTAVPVGQSSELSMLRSVHISIVCLVCCVVFWVCCMCVVCVL